MTDATCTIEGCERRCRAKGLCPAHYTARRRSGAALDRSAESAQCCAVDCERTVYARTYCASHYARLMRHGDPGSATPLGTKGEQWAYYLAEVYTVTDACKVWPFALAPNGYGYVVCGGKLAVHQLACLAWHGPRPPGMWAAHGPCHNRACWNGAHVSWKTPQGNHADRYRDGTSDEGEKNSQAKLTTEEVLQIRADYLHGGITQRELGEAYGVSQTHVSDIVRGKVWAHLRQLSGKTT